MMARKWLHHVGLAALVGGVLTIYWLPWVAIPLYFVTCVCGLTLAFVLPPPPK